MEWNHCGFVYLFNSSQAQLETQIHIAVAVGWCEFGINILHPGLVALFGFGSGAFSFIDLKKWKIYV